jgi:hypothetical protein
MRTVQSSNVIQITPRPASYGRRPIHPAYAGVTCLVLIQHSESEKALFVSDNGDRSKAVWVPKAMVSIDRASRLGFLVATTSKRFAEQKNLHPRFIDPEGFSEEITAALWEAAARAAKKRNQLRNHHEPLPYPGRNAFA